MHLRSRERALAERHHAPELYHARGRDLVELGESVGVTRATTRLTNRGHEAAENQRRIIEAQKRSLEDQKRSLESQKRRIQNMEKTIENQRSIIEHQDLLMGDRNRSIQRLRDELQSMSARVAAAEALPGKEKEAAVSVSGLELRQRKHAEHAYLGRSDIPEHAKNPTPESRER